MKTQNNVLRLFYIPPPSFSAQPDSLCLSVSLLPIPVLPAMEELDGDEVRVSSRGRLAERDIVQVFFIILFDLAGKGSCIFLSTRHGEGG